MGWTRRLERAWKHAAMRGAGACVRARRLDADAVASMEPRAVLVARQHNQLGDMTLALPAIRAIRRRWPDARIGVVASAVNAGVLGGAPEVDRVFVFRKGRPLAFWRTLHAIRSEAWDLAVALHTVSFSFTNLMFAVLSGARVRIGSTSPRVGDLGGRLLELTLPLPDPSALAVMNEAEHNLVPLRAVGIDIDDLAPRIEPPPPARRRAAQWAERLWRDGAWRLVVHPGAGKAQNIWPARRFAAVIDALAERHPVRVALVEGPRDAGRVRAVAAAARTPVDVVRGTILEVAALASGADLVVCNDTGVMHVVAAAGAPTLAIFGPTDPVRWAPRAPTLTVVRAPGGRLEALSAERVVAAALERLGRARDAGADEAQ